LTSRVLPARVVAIQRSRPTLLLARAARGYLAHHCSQQAAAISYYAFFSLFPLALLAAALFGVLLHNDALEARVLEHVIDALPIDAPVIADSLRALAGLGPTVTVVSFVAVLWGANALAAALRAGFTTVFNVQQERPFLHAKLLDYTLLFVLGMLMLVSVVLTTALRVAQEEFHTRLGLFDDRLA